MSNAYFDIDVIACVQGNTVRNTDSYGKYGSFEKDRCVVYNFREKAERPARAAADHSRRSYPERSRRVSSKRQSVRKTSQGNRYTRKRAARADHLRTVLFAVFLIAVLSGIGGIASKAKSSSTPEAYKYYDTITVGYQENILDIVLKYDNREYYKTQRDYVEELCRINNLAYDDTSYPNVAPGTHLVVPYYSKELK